MKTKATYYSLMLAAVVFLFASCGEKKNERTEDHADHEHTTSSEVEEATTKPQFDVSQEFQSQLAKVFTAYVELKDAFVSSNSVTVKAESADVQQSLNGVDMKLLSGAAHNDWMTFSSGLQKSLDEIKATSDIEAQRKSFSTLSDNLYKSIKAFGLGGEEAYYEFCPMAFDDAGGYWLSDVDQIRNPYFGNKMLSCGEVVEKLQ